MDYPRLSWPNHLNSLRWRQGEHILVSGPTSAGKTTLVRPLLERRSHVIALFTKLKDDTITSEFKGFKRFEKWPKQGFTREENRVMIWPKPEKHLNSTIAKQRFIMNDALDRIARDGRWAVFVDEMLYMTDARYMNLGKPIGMLHYFGRSSGVSMVTATQRPYWIPKIILSSITHGYFARTYDAGDQKRLSELGSMNPKEIIANMANLSDRHDFMYLNPQGDSPSSIVNTRK